MRIDYLRLCLLGMVLGFCLIGKAQSTIAQWTFEPVSGTVANPTANVGSGTAQLTGSMTGPGTGTGMSGSGCGSQTSGTTAWAISTAAPGTVNESSGAQFSTSTSGYTGIIVRWDQRNSNTAVNTVRLQWTDNGTTWNNFTMTSSNTTVCLGSIDNGRFEANTTGDQFRRVIVDLSSISTINNNPNFAVRMVAAHYRSTGEFRQTATPSSAATGGTWRFDNVTFAGTPVVVLPTVSLSASATTASETSPSAITITATASSPVTGSQTVTLNVAGTGITAGDYSMPQTVITIPDGQTTGSVSFTVVDDNEVEGTETATIGIVYTSAGLTPGTPSSQSISISDNDVASSPIRITEYMYQGTNGEFVELTNTGNIAVDITGWSFDDNSRLPGSFSLGLFGIVKPGESVIITENTAAAFRAAWGLCENVKVVGGLTQNLGRADEINIYDGTNTLIDRLTYDDQTLGGVRTQNSSAWVPASALGVNNTSSWILSFNGDVEQSFVSSGNDVGSPGKSQRATIAYNPCLPGAMRITEYMYQGVSGEFVEFTNVGVTPVDMSGWSFDDNSRIPGSFDLSSFGTVQPGESVILTEAASAAFRSSWNLCAGVKVIGSQTQGLGRADEINLYNNSGQLIDRLTYDDQTLGGVRTQNISAWVSAGGLGQNNPAAWTLSIVNDGEQSIMSTGNDVGSPGKSQRAIVSYDPCLSSAPLIVINTSSTSNYIDGGVIASPVSPYAVSGVVSDAADPIKTLGIDFDVSDDVTPASSLVVTATSSNMSVVAQSGLIITGTGSTRKLSINPVAAGYTNIIVTVNDGSQSASFTLNYAASLNEGNGTRWHTGIADASGAIVVDNDYMLIANDETNYLYLYNRNNPGLYVSRFDFNPANILGLTDGNAGAYKEVDVEAGTISPVNTNKSYWIGSLSNSSNAPFDSKPNRNRLFSVTSSGSGASSSFALSGVYQNLRQQLIAWGDLNGYNFSASAANGVDPKQADGFNIEGMVFGPDQSTMYIGFRAPLVPTGARTRAVIAPIQNFETWFNGLPASGLPVIGAPIELDLGGRGIRDLVRLSNGNYIIVAGMPGDVLQPAIYTWTGQPSQSPVAQPSFDFTGINVEAVLPVVEGGQLALNKLQVIADNGDKVFYNDGIAAKDLPFDNYRKFFAAVIVSSVGGVLPVRFDYFTAQRQSATVQLKWKMYTEDGLTGYEIERSLNGVNFSKIGYMGVQQMVSYYFTDNLGTTGKVYYRIVGVSTSGFKTVSAIRVIQADGMQPLITVYPNPVSGNTFSLVTSVQGVKKIELFNSSGIRIDVMTMTETSKEIVIRDYAPGIYVIRLSTVSGDVYTQNLLIR